MNLKKFLRSFLYTNFYAHTLTKTDLTLARLFRLSRKERKPVVQNHVLLAATGQGNIGDQAMLEAFLENTPGRKTVLLTSLNALIVPEQFAADTEIVVLDGLVQRPALARLGVTWQFCQIISGASAFSVTGADIMDGRYNPSRSLARISLLRIAEVFAIPSRVLGFSWAPDALTNVSRSLGTLQETRLLVRDPASYERVLRTAANHVELVTDTVFSASLESAVPDEISIWLSNSDKPVLILNVSGLIDQRIQLDDDYASVVEYAHAAGYRVLFLPHVIREGDNDLTSTDRVFKQASSDEDLIFRGLLQPSQVRRLAKSARLIITGRMHLAIIALSSAIPALTLGTQGKVEGLYKLFGIEEFVLEPEAGFSDAAITHIYNLESRYDALIQSISARIPTIREMSAKNFK